MNDPHIAHFKNFTYLCKNIQNCKVTMHAFYVIIFEGVCTSVECKCTVCKSLCVVCGHGTESCYWIIDDQAFSSSYNLAPYSIFPPSPIRQQVLPLTLPPFSFPTLTLLPSIPFILLSPNYHLFPFPQWLLPSCLSCCDPLTITFFLSHSDSCHPTFHAVIH
jgi:hypothetical protein